MKKIIVRTLLLCLLFSALFPGALPAQDNADMAALYARIAALEAKADDQRYSFDQVLKGIEDALWYHIVGDVAYIDRVRLTGPPRHKTRPTGNEFADALLDNELIFHAYVFIPRTAEPGGKYPLIVFPHGGIHGTFNTVNYHVVKEWLAQGYIIIAPDYRGSTGYGRRMHMDIDYGGRENDDVLASRDYMVENYSMVDPARVGIAGWSHGGMISLMNILNHPDSYACAFAGVPVSDVAYRLSYKRPGYTDEFTAEHHIGRSPEEDPEEYARRSPVTYAANLRKPLMINTNTNDDDVGHREVQRMIDALLAHGKDFEWEVYEDVPGSHFFDRIDTKQATELRYKMHKYLEKHLKPPKPFGSHADMRRAGYFFD